MLNAVRTSNHSLKFATSLSRMQLATNEFAQCNIQLAHARVLPNTEQSNVHQQGRASPLCHRWLPMYSSTCQWRCTQGLLQPRSPCAPGAGMPTCAPLGKRASMRSRSACTSACPCAVSMCARNVGPGPPRSPQQLYAARTLIGPLVEDNKPNLGLHSCMTIAAQA